ncbi:glycoside hydrolase family 1 protein [Leptospira wolffii]|uniref:glycoside hydrolase family 1 protein n=1 Tax=Leptospira wolffii TaxID=409998 RepID=UPI0002DED4B3|nr:glycoside hydrolase family 1 protein [Leptospira wolffii]EPG64505.1 glycoside hydrolase, family 1 domain protein [Leptospira wolffii serovar Khorat str. Khorat-H2]
MSKSFELPKEFLLGSATAATQIEGGDTNNNWYYWSIAGKVGNGESSLTGADHYRRYAEDIELLSELHQECYRMSIEWSRLEPQAGQWSKDAVEHYRDEFQKLSKAGIRPLVTLHHFSCPQWFQEKGGWLSENAVEDFIRFTDFSVKSFGDLVSEWCTINEPNVFANDTYMDGKYPPGTKGDIGAYIKVSKRMVLAHLKSYKLIHRIRKEHGFSGETKVGFAHHFAVFEPLNSHPLAKLGCFLSDYLFHEIQMKGFVEGRLVFPLGSGTPEGKGIFCDFIGINYYSRHLFQASYNPGNLFAIPMVDPLCPESRKNDLGWEIYPEGLYKVCHRAWDKYKLPIYITENGIPDEKDEKREEYIVDHLAQIRRLLDEGVGVERYYHWSFLDNLEWNDGYGPRFGLVEVDYKTMERKPRPSARKYAEMCKTKKIEKKSI